MDRNELRYRIISTLLQADGPLPAGWKVRVKLDDEVAGEAEALPAEVPVNLSALDGQKHRLWIGIVDEKVQVAGWVDRYFEPGKPGRESW